MHRLNETGSRWAQPITIDDLATRTGRQVAKNFDMSYLVEFGGAELINACNTSFFSHQLHDLWNSFLQLWGHL